MRKGKPTPSVSVIMIFLDAEAYIGEAIESVLAQTETDWELLLVDDGSTDGSTGIARRYAAAAAGRIRYLEHPGHENRGMSASRNLGIARAGGDFIGFLDADDVWMPERLERPLAILRAHDEVGMVFTRTLFWHTWSDAARVNGVSDWPIELKLEPDRIHRPPTVLLDFLESGGSTLPGICSLLARRRVAQQVGGFEDSFRGCYEDQVFLSKMCLHTPVYVLDDVLAKYRQHPQSHCHRAIRAGEYDPDVPNPARERYLSWLDGYLRAHAPGEPRLLAALQKELWPYRKSWIYAVKRTPAFRYAKLAARRSFPPQAYAWLRQQMVRQLVARPRS
jgi:glycosyltransferase involved in cell wall biosynthesis